MITKTLVKKHLQMFLDIAHKNIEKQNFNSGFRFLELFARLSYNYNIFYTNDVAEALISQTSTSLLKKNKVNTKKNRIVFYDSFAIDNRGLTQQYLRAIFSWNCDLLFITNSRIGSDILDELNSYSKASILIYDKNNLDGYQKVVNEIISFEPEKVFLHFSPWDISGFCIWNSIDNVDRFLINLTDHAFWLGKNCADYILEFRRYGSYMSVNERNIPIKKLLLQPYYPIISSKEFQGFPFARENKIIAFAGSNLYKIADKNNTFLRLIKKVLLQNDNLIFVLAGPGNSARIEKFINENNLINRFILVGDRKDISAVIENIDIYVNTFPMIGGLMSQYAAFYNKPIIGYTSKKLYGYNDVEDLLQVHKEGLLVKTTENEFVEYFKQLVENEKCREINILLTSDSILTHDEFCLRLYENVFNFNETIDYPFFLSVNYDSQAIADLYLDIENSYLKSHYSVIWSILKFKMLKYFPLLAIKVIYIRLFTKINSI